MTDAPERICYVNCGLFGEACACYRANMARVDLSTPLHDPRVKALVEAGKAVVDRWDSPLWKDLPHTGESIADLRAALSALEGNELDEPLHRHIWNPPTNFGSKEE